MTAALVILPAALVRQNKRSAVLAVGRGARLLPLYPI